MEQKTNTSTSKEYPLLTWAVLEKLERKAKAWRINPADCELIEHYFNSIGGENQLAEFLEEQDVFSFEDIEKAFIKEDIFDPRPPYIAGFLLGCIHDLMDRLDAGEKIY